MLLIGKVKLLSLFPEIGMYLMHLAFSFVIEAKQKEVICRLEPS
jgi:hypothetical protein